MFWDLGPWPWLGPLTTHLAKTLTPTRLQDSFATRQTTPHHGRQRTKRNPSKKIGFPQVSSHHIQIAILKIPIPSSPRSPSAHAHFTHIGLYSITISELSATTTNTQY